MTAYWNPSRKAWYFKCDKPRTKAEKRSQYNRGPFRTKRDALSAERELLSTAPRPTDNDTPTLLSYLEDWVSLRAGLKQTTHDTYCAAIKNHVAPHRLAATRLSDITPSDIDSHFRTLSQKPGRGGHRLSAKTQQNIHRFLRTALEDAVDRGLLATNPIPKRSPAGRPHTPQINVWSNKEISSFLAHVSAEDGPSWRKPLYTFALLTGCRRGEILALKWIDVDLKHSTVHIRASRNTSGYKVIEDSPKTSSGRRSIHLPEELVMVLMELVQDYMEHKMSCPDWNPQGYVFVSSKGEALHPDRVTKRFATDVRKCRGVRNIKFHGLRHTYASIALSLGEYPKVVSQRLGHSNVAFTLSQYAHVLPIHDADSAQRVALAMLNNA